jgi:hypothetical protein
MLVVNIVLGLIFSALPHVLGDGLSSVISGTLISPFLALVVTLVYYRLVGISTPAASGPSGGYQQGYGGFAQSPQGGDPYGGGYGGYQPPPQGGGGYGGYNQPPLGGSEPPTQQVPRNDGSWEPPAQPPR